MMKDWITSIINKLFNNKEAKNALWLILGRVVQLCLSFVISIFTARYLGPGNYGIINYVGSYGAFFTSLCTLGINSVIVKELIDHPNEQGEAVGTAIVLRLVSSFLSALLIVLIIWIVDGNDPLLVAVACLTSISLVFQAFDTINYWFQSRYESKVTATSILIAYIVVSAYKIVLLILQKDVKWFAFASTLDYIVLALLQVIAYKRNHGPKLCFSLAKAKSLLLRSYNYILSGMMVAIYGNTDKIMLKQMLNEEAVGYYSLASTLNSMWVFVLAAIIDSMFPTIMRLFNNDRDAYLKKNRQLYAIVIYISISVSVLFVLFGKFGITLLYGDAYLGAVRPLQVITWYTAFSYLGVARDAWILCENKQQYLKWLYLSAAIINIILNYLLIPIAGASGAALASLATQICTSILIPLFIRDLRPNALLMLDGLLLRKLK